MKKTVATSTSSRLAKFNRCKWLLLEDRADGIFTAEETARIARNVNRIFSERRDHGRSTEEILARATAPVVPLYGYSA